MLYPKEVIIHLNAWMDGSLQSKNWLQQNNYEELVPSISELRQDGGCRGPHPGRARRAARTRRRGGLVASGSAANHRAAPGKGRAHSGAVEARFATGLRD